MSKDIKDIGILKWFSIVTDTDSIFEKYSLIIELVEAVIPVTNGTLFVKGIEYTILECKIYSEDTAIFVDYKLTIKNYNKTFLGGTLSELATQLGLSFTQIGSVEFNPLGGLKLYMIANQFISEQSKLKNFKNQFIISAVDQNIFIGNPSSYSRVVLELDPSKDFQFISVKDFTGSYDAYKGSPYIFGEGDLITPISYSGVMLAKKVIVFKVPPEIDFSYGIWYNIPSIPFMGNQWAFLYSKIKEVNNTTIVLCLE